MQPSFVRPAWACLLLFLLLPPQLGAESDSTPDSPEAPSAQAALVEAELNQNSLNQIHHPQDRYQITHQGCWLEHFKPEGWFSRTPLKQTFIELTPSGTIPAWYVTFRCYYAEDCVLYRLSGGEPENAVGFWSKDKAVAVQQALKDLAKGCAQKVRVAPKLGP